MIPCIELVYAYTSKNFCGWGGYPCELGETGFRNDPTYVRIDPQESIQHTIPIGKFQWVFLGKIIGRCRIWKRK